MDAGPPGSQAAVTTAPECAPLCLLFRDSGDTARIRMGCRGATDCGQKTSTGTAPPPSRVSTPSGSPPRIEGLVAVVPAPLTHMLTSWGGALSVDVFCRSRGLFSPKDISSM